MSTLNQIKVENTLYDIEDKQAREELLNKINKVEGKDLSTNDFTNEYKEKLNGLSNYDDTELRNEISNKANKTEIPVVPTKTSELENDSGFLTEHQDLSEFAKKTEIPSIDGLATEEYVDNAIANIDIPSGGEGSSGGGNVSAFSYVFTSTEDLKIIILELPADLNKAIHFNIHITFPNVQTTFKLYSIFGNYTIGFENVPVSSKSAVNLYAIRHINSENLFASSFKTAPDYPNNARPAMMQMTSLRVPSGSNIVKFYSHTEGVLLPEGTTFEIWGVYEI